MLSSSNEKRSSSIGKNPISSSDTETIPNSPSLQLSLSA